MANEGKIQVQSDLIPDNDNPRQPVTSSQYVKGGTQTFGSITELVSFHPAKMQRGMSGRVVTIDLVSQRATVDEFALMVDPLTLLDANKNTIVTEDTYLKYWSRTTQTLSQGNRVFEYSPDGPSGTRPPYPYVDSPAFEVNWHSIAAPSDRWVRFRDDDDFVIVGFVSIFTGWTLPVSIGQQNIQGDYIDQQYIRQDVDTTIRTSITGLINNKDYLILTGTVTETPVTGPQIIYTVGRVIHYQSANDYLFSGDGSVRETVPAPPRTIGGLANNNPIGFSDTPPLTSGQLWNIYAPKSVYGDLKGDWQVRKINENPDLIRYSEFASPNPNEIVGTNDPAYTGSQGDTDLNGVGWKAVFEKDFKFVAERQETGSSPTYTQWEIRRISGESGEYTERVFKLFDINLDFDDVTSFKPVTSDAIAEGFSDTPLEETDTKINWVFEARKFFDGTLKGSWSNGTPYSGKDVFNDIITSDGGDNFKYNPNSATPNAPFPSLLTLTAQLFRGLSNVWETTDVTYLWERIYNNGAVESLVISSYTNIDPLYLLAGSGSFGDPGYIGDGQRLIVTPEGVTGKAIFRCTQTMVIPGGTDIVFVELISINDVTDGLDAKDLSIKADGQLVIYDNVGIAFAPSQINLNAFFNNLIDPFIRWFIFESGVWLELERGDSSLAPEFIITDTDFGSRLTIDSASLFDPTDDLQEFRFAASTANNPDSADSVTTFSDYTTITKASAAAVGTPGKDSVFARFDNEYQNIILDDDTGIPFAGEIGPTGKAQTIISFFDGITQIPYGAGSGKFTIGLSSDNGSVTFGSNTSGLTNDVRVYVNTWGAGQRKAVCTATLNYDTGTGNIIFTKKFTVGSTLDTPGALSVIIDSNGGFEFHPSDRSTPKALTANVYDSSKTPQLQSPSSFYFSWTVAGVPDVGYTQGGGGTNGQLRSVSRASVLLSAFVSVKIAKVASPGVNDIVREVSVRINDVADGRLYRLFSAATSAPAKPSNSVGPAGNGTWFPSRPIPLWAVDGYEDAGSSPSTYTWSNPYAIGGEKGDQGFSGGTAIFLYRSTGTDPNTVPSFGSAGNLSTIAQMVAAGWRSSTPGQLPTSGYIWETQRLYKTQNGAGTQLLFDANGYPINEVPYSANSVWIRPQRITPIPGNNGTQGIQGPIGPQGIQGPVGPQGPSGALATGGSKYKVDSNRFGGYTSGVAINHPSISFQLPNESNWKPLVKFTTTFAAVDNSTGQAVRLQIQRSTDNVNFAAIGNPGDYGSITNARMFCEVEIVDSTAAAGVTYYYRLAVTSYYGGNVFLSSGFGYRINLIPG